MPILKKAFLLFIAALFICSYSYGQIITTFAGNGISGYSGDGGPADSAEMGLPWSVATDNYGNVYFSDNPNLQSRVRKVNAAGVISTIAGNGTGGYSGDGGLAIDAQVNAGGVAVDVEGNIYFSDEVSHRIRKVDTSGIITTIAGTGVAGYTGDGGLAISATLNRPWHIAIDIFDNLFFTDIDNAVVRKINTLGVISTFAGTGIQGYTGDGGLATIAELNYPVGIATDAIGNVFISDLYSNVVRKVDTFGIISTVAGNGSAGYMGDGGSAVTAELSRPDGLAIDGSGNLFICEEFNVSIRMVNTSGIISTVAGGTASCIWPDVGDGGPAISGCLARPNDVKVDIAGNLYISDGVHNRIRKIADTTGSYPLSHTNSFKVYPNPSSGAVTAIVRSDKECDVHIVACNVLGQIVKEVISTTNKDIDIALNEPAGIYFLSASSRAGNWCRKVRIAP